VASEEPVGVVTHYYGRIGVAVIRLTDADLRVGDLVRIRGRTTDFTQPVASLQIEHRPVAAADRGTQVALKVRMRVRRGDQVVRVPELEPPAEAVDEP